MQNSKTSPDHLGSATLWTSERLDSWKEVASFFKREVRTVQLWEKSEGLPIRRHRHKKLGSVYAYRRELEDWWIARTAQAKGEGQTARTMDASGLTVVSNADRQTFAAIAREETNSSCISIAPIAVIHSTVDGNQCHHSVERFAEGLREDILLELTRREYGPLMLHADCLANSASSTSSATRSPAKETQARVQLSATIRYSGQSLRVSVQLIRTSDFVCLWSERFDVFDDSGFDTQADLALQIAQAIPPRLLRECHVAGGGKPAQNAEIAQQACSMGYYYWRLRSKSALTKAVGYFQDAIEIDPRCADAYAGLADTYISLSYNHMMAAQLAATSAASAVETALQLQGNSIHVRNAHINLLINCSWDWTAAERKCQEATHSGDFDERTIQLYSSLMTCIGRHPEAISLALHGYRRASLSDLINGQVALAYFYAGDYCNAMSFLRRTIQLQPKFLMGYALLGRTEVALGNLENAKVAFQKGIEVGHGSPFLQALLAYAHASAGDSKEARSLLLGLQEDSHDACFPAYDVSAIHSVLNEERAALTNLRRAMISRDMKSIFAKHDPRFFKLQRSSGFQQVISTLNCSSGLKCAV